MYTQQIVYNPESRIDELIRIISANSYGNDEPLLELIRLVDGTAFLSSLDNQFLGLLSSDRNNPDSIINPHTFLNPSNPLSLANKSGLYASVNSPYSVYNPNAVSPPIVYYKSKKVIIVTANPSALLDLGLWIVTPQLLIWNILALNPEANRDLMEEARLTNCWS